MFKNLFKISFTVLYYEVVKERSGHYHGTENIDTQPSGSHRLTVSGDMGNSSMDGYKYVLGSIMI